jgi:hypothetical protein
MAYQNLNQYNYPRLKLKLIYDGSDISIVSDERGFNEEVVFSPYLIAQTYGKKLPIYFDIDDPESVQPQTLTYGQYDFDNVFISLNSYPIEGTCFSASSSCDIGLTGIDNGLVQSMSGEEIFFTNGIFEDSVKFDRMYYDRRMKLIQVTGYTQSPNVRFSGRPLNTLYEVTSGIDPVWGRYHELYGGFYQGFYKLFGYDYSIIPERQHKGWAVEMLLRPRLIGDIPVGSGNTTLNMIYPNNKNTFFYMGTRAENKYYHHADGSPNCVSGYTRVTESLANCWQTCACCDRRVFNSRCIYVYPPRSVNGVHDPHVNYGCNICGGVQNQAISCGCGCNFPPCESCGWECQYHNCPTIIHPSPTATPTPTPTPTCQTPSPTPSPSGQNCPCTNCGCTSCSCYSSGGCSPCSLPSGFTSVENTCETNPLLDAVSNNISFRLCGDPSNPGIGIRVVKWTGGCETTGTCITGQTYITGVSITDICTPPIYPYCEIVNPAYLDERHWFLLDVVYERYTYLDECDLFWRGGLGTITKEELLESLANNAVSLIQPPYTNGQSIPGTIELVELTDEWLDEIDYRKGRLKIYVNGKLIFTIENFEEVIPRPLSTDKEKQVGVPFNISWGGGTQGLHENLTLSACTEPLGPYIQDPESFPDSILSGTSLSAITTNIILEKYFGGTFEGAINQFRFYIEPLTSDEVKHNFKLLKDKFTLFNPDCPDCGRIACEPGEFSYEIVVCDANDFTYLITES